MREAVIGRRGVEVQDVYPFMEPVEPYMTHFDIHKNDTGHENTYFGKVVYRHGSVVLAQPKAAPAVN